MKRLTVKRPDGRWAIANNDNANPTEQMLKIPLVIDRLAAYEDTEMEPKDIKVLKAIHGLSAAEIVRLCNLYRDAEDGRVMVLPCPMGSTIYMIVTKHTKGREPFSFIKTTELMESNVFRVCRDFGKTVFLTREEAERAIAQQ